MSSLTQRAARCGDSTAYTFLSDGEAVTASLTARELHVRARGIARALLQAGAQGRPVLLLCPAGLDYVASLVACFYAGAIAVPAYPPTRTGLARTLPRIRAICADCDPAVVLITRPVRELLAAEPELRTTLARAQQLEVDTLEADCGEDPLPEVAPTAPALLQYTSGSTATPKGVVVTHAQLLANEELIRVGAGLRGDDVVLSWLPPYHDMGLVGGILQPLYTGAHAVLLPPDVFVRRPLRWLAAATRFRATVLLAPNFAFETCVQRIGEAERRALDLASVRVVFVGAEPVRADTLERFARAFAATGFRSEAFYPCYGMAEATLIISGGSPGRGAHARDFDADGLTRGRAQPLALDAEPRSRRLVGCGHALPGEQIRIVHPDTHRELDAYRVGEIWVQGPSVASGYFRKPEATADTFHAFTAGTELGPMLRTGDLGFVDERGELFITGRLKDLIILRGRNHAPQDIERTVQALDPALVLDGGAAFSVDTDGGEQLVVVQEVDKRTGADPSALVLRVPEAIAAEHDVTPAAVVLIKRGSLAKTSSGKVRRGAMRDAFLAGALDVSAEWRLPSARVTERPTLTPAATASTAASRVTARTVPSRKQLEIEEWLRARIAHKLNVAPSSLDPDEPLARYGVDSMLAAELIEDLQQWLGTPLDTTLSYDHPSLAGLSRAIAARASSSRVTRTAPARSSLVPQRPTVPAPAADADAVAIVGMGCRFPGAPSLEAFWDLLCEGRDAIREVPKERWDADALYDPDPGAEGRTCSKWGGFVERIESFDAAFFGITPHEAARMDPQQRLFLEVAWEALEDAGIAPAGIAGSDAGVFAGVCTSDFALLYGGELGMIDGDYGTGSAPSLVANRVSYQLDLRGPSETIDAACASSLVALHHAVRSLQDGECELALVGGVNAVLAPEVSVALSHLGALARDGRCKAFDARADGFVRSEGAGVVVLKRLSRALADGDRVYAVVAGVAVNHDGRSNGITAPSGSAQRAVIERALQRAHLLPDALDYVEAHGVGSKVGDAVELHALADIAARSTRAAKLRVGSAKTNIGHLEAASGIASLIKVALALRHESLPAQLHFEQPPPALHMDELAIEIATQQTPWPRTARPRAAGVSAFGLGGTNAHVVVREAPEPTHALELRATARAPRRELLTLSAKTASALHARVEQLLCHLARDPELRLADVCFTANAGRASFEHRLAVLATTTDELRDGLLAALRHEPSPRWLQGAVPSGGRTLVGFAFEERPLAPDATASVLDAHPALTRSLEASERLLAPHLPRALRDVMRASSSDDRELLASPRYAHAVRVSLARALVELYRELGIEPFAVYGSGAGEYAAAACAGSIDWESALVLATRRGALVESLTPGAQQLVTLRQIERELAALDRSAVPPSIPFFSAALGRTLEGSEAPDSMFFAHRLLLTPTQEQVGPALSALGCALSISLCASAESAAATHGADDPLRALAVHGGDDPLVAALAELYVRGAALDWRALYAQRDVRVVSLPTYPFERERHWLDLPRRPRAQSAPAAASAELRSSHPLISRMRVSHPPGQSGVFETEPKREAGTHEAEPASEARAARE